MRPSRPTVVITVSQPCHEGWARMTPAARGRHCAACAKEVVDVTRQTDAELLASPRLPLLPAAPGLVLALDAAGTERQVSITKQVGGRVSCGS